MGLDGPQPMYQQIAAELERRISAGEYERGRPFTSQARICAEFEVSPRTAISAIKVLADAGLVQSVPGKGTYVVEPGNAEAPDDAGASGSE
jgi:GntR family transcriptional regulator